VKAKNFFPCTIKAVFQKRPNRFIVECTIQGSPVRAYLPNPGRLWELFFPGSVLYLMKQPAEKTCSTDYTVVAVEREGRPIMLHTHVNNLVARQLIEEGYIRGLEGSIINRPEVRIGRSRFDFLLLQEGKEVIVEVKSCTLVGNRIAMFPDAVTERGTRHLQELSEIAMKGTKAVVLFLVHWAKADFFMPEWHTDLVLSQTLLAVKDRVQVTALSVEWKQGLILGNIREISIPWQIVEQEAHDRGSYIVILQLKRDRLLQTAGPGKVAFRKGYYMLCRICEDESYETG
jgi:sugar fermentation stimulation protein A